jgi:hypothetical protein
MSFLYRSRFPDLWIPLENPSGAVELNRKHWAVNSDLAGMWVLNGNDPPIDLVTGRPSTKTGTVTLVDGNRGQQNYFNNANNYYQVGPGAILANKPSFSIMAGAQLNSSVKADGRVLYCERAASGNDILKLIQQGGDVKLQSVYRNDAGNLQFNGGSANIADGLQHVHSWSFNAGSSGNRIFTDGVLVGTATYGNSTTQTDAIVPLIGGDAQDTLAWWGDYISWVAIWTRALGDDEISYLSANWKEMLQSRSRRVWGIATSAAATYLARPRWWG